MSSNSRSKVANQLATDLNRWQTEDDKKYETVKSLVGSIVEFTERCGQKQRVVGTLEGYHQNQYCLKDTTINGEYFGDYVINDYEVRKWRLKEYRECHKPKKSQQNRSSFDS